MIDTKGEAESGQEMQGTTQQKEGPDERQSTHRLMRKRLSSPPIAKSDIFIRRYAKADHIPLFIRLNDELRLMRGRSRKHSQIASRGMPRMSESFVDEGDESPSPTPQGDESPSPPPQDSSKKETTTRTTTTRTTTTTTTK